MVEESCATECTDLTDAISGDRSLTIAHLSRTANPKITFTMREVLKNQQLIGTCSRE